MNNDKMRSFKGSLGRFRVNTSLLTFSPSALFYFVWSCEFIASFHVPSVKTSQKQSTLRTVRTRKRMEQRSSKQRLKAPPLMPLSKAKSSSLRSYISGLKRTRN